MRSPHFLFVLFRRNREIFAQCADFFGEEETGGRFADHRVLQDAALLDGVARKELRGVGGVLRAADCLLLRFGVGERLLPHGGAEIVVDAAECERRDVCVDGVTRVFGIFGELRETHVGCLDVDRALLETLKDVVVLLPVVVELRDVLLVLVVPGGEDFLLLMNLAALFRRHLGRGRRREAPERRRSREEEREGEKCPDLSVGKPAVEQHEG